MSQIILQARADSLVSDENGFAVCYSNSEKSYYFDWDQTTKSSIRRVYYLEVNNCNNVKLFKNTPQENLHSVTDILGTLPLAIQSSVNQILAGAHVFRIEISAAEYIKNRSDKFMSNSPEVITQLRNDVGDTFAEEVIQLFSKKIIAKNSNCESFIGSCDFYLCQEQSNQCGLDGYNLSYGYKYCSGSRFKLLDQMKTDLGKQWTLDVMSCLQKKNLEASKILSESENKCSQISSTSYDAHPDCYIQSGFCNLNIIEKLRVINLVKKEILSIHSIKMGQDLLNQCGSNK